MRDLGLKKVRGLVIIITTFLVVGISPTTFYAMQIFVKQPSGETISLEVEPTDRIEDVKAKICDKTEIPIEKQNLWIEDSILEDGNTLQDYSIQKDGTIQLTVENSSTLKKIVNIEAPSIPINRMFLNEYTAEDVVLSTELGKTVLASFEDGSVKELYVDWIVLGVYDVASETENTFKWRVREIEDIDFEIAEDVALEGTVVIKNKLLDDEDGKTEEAIEQIVTSEVYYYISEPYQRIEAPKTGSNISGGLPLLMTFSGIIMCYFLEKKNEN